MKIIIKIKNVFIISFLVAAVVCCQVPESKYDFSKVDSLVNSAVADSVFPGAVLSVGYNGHVIYEKAYGKFMYSDNAQPMTTNAIFDLASVTKVIGTTSAAMILYDDGKLDLDRKVSFYLPKFGNHGKENITIRNLLLHNSGLPAFKRYYDIYSTGKEVINDIMNTELDYEPGSKYVYSDLGMITLQQVIEKITGEGIDKYLTKRVFIPLEMTSTFYNPPKNVLARCVPTEVDNYWRMDTIRGRVHDERAAMLNGVAGHAGLFSTAGDLSKFMMMMMNGGEYKGIRIFKQSTIEAWTTKQGEQSDRAIGWDTKSPEGYSSAGSHFSLHSFGHTGFTGTSVWADKDTGLFVIFLSNRVFPTRANRKIIGFRPILHDAVYEAVFTGK